MFSLRRSTFAYEPYPVCYATEVFEGPVYDELAQTYPDRKLFQHKPELGDKYSLSERNNADQYHKFLASSPAWGRLHSYVKSKTFVDETLEFLKSHNIDLGLGNYAFVSKARAKRASLLSRIRRMPELGARFEFSAMGGNGGHILPHTDNHNKLITLVLSMNEQETWNQAWGGGTEICMPRDRSKIFNHVNFYMGFDDVELLGNYGFHPNQCLLFIKTFNSWHQVSPIHTPSSAPLRKTLTINIERLV